MLPTLGFLFKTSWFNTTKDKKKEGEVKEEVDEEEKKKEEPTLMQKILHRLSVFQYDYLNVIMLSWLFKFDSINTMPYYNPSATGVFSVSIILGKVAMTKVPTSIFRSTWMLLHPSHKGIQCNQRSWARKNFVILTWDAKIPLLFVIATHLNKWTKRDHFSH